VDEREQQRRQRLAAGLLGLAPGEKVSSEQQKLSAATVSVVLSDMIGHIQRAVRERGSGIAIVKPTGDLAWFSAEDVVEELDKAVRGGDAGIATVFRDILTLLEKLDPDDHVLFGMATGSALRVFRLPIDDPSGYLRRLLQEWGG
jgi:hypothetical protein